MSIMVYFDFFEKSHFLTVFVLKLWCVPRPEKRENSRKKFENQSIFANFMNLNHILNKVGKARAEDLFSI
jgi:hypothetical protein